MNRPNAFSRLITFLVLTAIWMSSLLMGTMSVRADSGPGSSGSGEDAVEKCSPDLLKLAESNGSARVKVIMQNSSDSGDLLDLLRDFGGKLLATFPQLNASLVEIS